MRAFVIVMTLPLLYFIPRFVERSKPVLVKTFIPKLTIQTLNKSVLCWFSWLNKTQPYIVAFAPEKHSFTGKFGAIIADNMLWLAALVDKLRQKARYLLS